MGSNTITIIACLIIIFLAAIYFFHQARKITKIKKLVKTINDAQDMLEEMRDTEFEELRAAYCKTLTINTGNYVKSNVYASDVFNEQNTATAFSLNLRLQDAASGILVGLGLLGTFVGLTFGIASFDSSSTDNIMMSIQGLLGGMATAFSTSLFGMLFSLPFTCFDKKWRNGLAKELQKMNDKLDEKYFIDDVSLSYLHQQEMIDGIYKKMQKQSEDIIAELQQRLSYENGDGTKTDVSNAVRDMLTENREQSKALKSFSTDLAMELNNGFDEVLSRQMQAKIVPLMESVDATTKSLVEHIDSVAAQMASPASDMIQSVVDQLKESMDAIMKEFKSNLSTSTTREMEGLAVQLGTAARAMSDFPKNMEQISSTLMVTIEEVKTAISEITSTSATSNSAAMRQMQEQITFATTAFGNAIGEVKEVMSHLTQTSQAQSNDMMAKMSMATENMAAFLNETMTKLSGQATDSMGEALNEVKEVMANISKNSQYQSNQMVGSLSEAAKGMGNYLTDTVSQLSDSVKTSVEDITENVSQQQTKLLQLQNDLSTETKHLLDSFNVGLDRLEKMNEYVKGTMDMFQQAQGQITGSTAHLQTLTGDMKLASQLFNKSQTDYNAKMQEMQSNSQRGIDAISQLLKESGDVTKDYAEKFEIIKEGIGEIFSKLQSGLTEYSRIVQASTQKYLDQYSTSLTTTTDALSTTIQQQNEVVESLVEALNKRH